MRSSKLKIVIFSQEEFYLTLPLLSNLFLNENIEIQAIVFGKDKFGIKRLAINLFFYGFIDFIKIIFNNLFFNSSYLKKIPKKFYVQKEELQSLDWYKNKNLKGDAAISINFPYKIPTNIIDFFPFGIFNIHNSDLPKYGGLMPIYRKLIKLDNMFSVTLQKINAELDSGFNIYQAFLPSKNGLIKPLAVWKNLNEITAIFLRQLSKNDLLLENQAFSISHENKTYYSLPSISEAFIFYVRFHLIKPFAKHFK